MWILKLILILKVINSFEFILYPKIGTLSRSPEQRYLILKEYTIEKRIIISELTPKADVTTNNFDGNFGIGTY